MSERSGMNEIDAYAQDRRARDDALDTARSFIVQAPAGSGKTELLIQRYLKLLATVDDPEEILAITFTRKAANEMRTRVLGALRDAQRGEVALSEHAAFTVELAHAALERDRERGWQLLSKPARLRVQTIDSLCVSLARSLPILSGLGGEPNCVDDARELYLEAARATLALLDTRDARAPDVARLLEHLDNDLARAQELLADALARRDLWMRPVHEVSDRPTLELALHNTALAVLVHADMHFDRGLRERVARLGRFAAAVQFENGSTSPVIELRECTRFPEAVVGALPHWLGVTELLLTKEGTWRKPKSVNVKVGFPNPNDVKGELGEARAANKRDMQTLLEELADNDPLRAALTALRGLPAVAYTDEQWEVLTSIVAVLKRAAAELAFVFAQRGEMDFTEAAYAALRALEPSDTPTDAKLGPEQRVTHALVDEFQDTSITQRELLERLTSDWSTGDGRTLFLVGDPMQSIYGFRAADVGVYLSVRERGLGNVTLTSLTLSRNFRSQARVLEWVNEAFARAMPVEEDAGAGAVRFTPCVATIAPLPEQAVTPHAIAAVSPDEGSANEARRVVEIVQSARRESSDASIAILVRDRNHLRDITPALRQAGIAYRAVEIEPLAAQPVVQDLLSLTRALTLPHNRLAWFALVRAPWCGIALPDLTALAEALGSRVLAHAIHDESFTAALSADGAVRFARLRATLVPALERVGRKPLRDVVEGAWRSLGAPASYQNLSAVDDARAFFDLLDACADATGFVSFAKLERALTRLYASSDAVPGAVEVMTIHKAKGLEWDVVIVPGILNRSRASEASLFQWLERLRDGEPELVVAPIRSRRDNEEPISAHVMRALTQRRALELTRLAYVAATRARLRLHWLGVCDVTRNDKTPKVAARDDSIAGRLWDTFAPAFDAAVRDHVVAPPDAGVTPSPVAPRTLMRLASRWRAPPLPAALAWQPRGEARHEDIEFSWAGRLARNIGTAVHRALERIARDGVEAWNAERIARESAWLDALLVDVGVGGADRAAARQRVQDALALALDDAKGRWLLSRARREARNEYRITGRLRGEIVDAAIDRTFVDEDDVRWIIDYKTGVHAGGELDAFLDREQMRYRDQLERYALAMRQLDARPIRLGLYFPLAGGWREWAFEG